MQTVDIGAGSNPHPDADLTIDQRPCADRQADLEDAWPLDTASCDRVIARHVLEHLAEPVHAFHEAARVLRQGGAFEVVVPLGHDAVMDHDHETVWTWEGPVQYCRERGRPWDPDVPFVLEAREPRDLRFAAPFDRLTPVLQHMATWWPAWACWRCYDGELYCRFKRVGDDE